MAILETKVWLDPAQFGFKEQRNTISAIKGLKIKIRDRLRNFKYCAASSIDIQGAFDDLN